jgi:hypothetical protein
MEIDGTNNPATKLAIELAECGDKIDALSEQLKKLNAEYDAREQQLIEHYDLNKIKSVKVMVGNRCRAVSAGKRFWARKKDGVQSEHVYDALIADGIPELAQRTFNTNSLTAYLKTQLAQEGASLPPHLAKVIDAKEFPSISIRTA